MAWPRLLLLALLPALALASRVAQRPNVAGRIANLAELAHDIREAANTDAGELSKLDSRIAELASRRELLRGRQVRRARELAFLRAEMGSNGTLDEKESVQDAAAAKVTAASSAATQSQEGSAELHSKLDTEDTAMAAKVAAANAAAAQSEEAAAEVVSKQDAEDAAMAAKVAAAEEGAADVHSKQDREELASRAEQPPYRVEVAKVAKPEDTVESPPDDSFRQPPAAGRSEAPKHQALADSADDSFKQFMREEDGEDQMGDSDYEDSANALAGAIGWDRRDIENKADSAVKQLTEAIGGKKVVQSLQGMMAGIR